MSLPPELQPKVQPKSLVLTGEMKGKITKRVAEKCVQVDSGHLVLKTTDSPCPVISLWNGRRFPLYICAFLMATNDASVLEDQKMREFQFAKCCAVPHCIAHHLPITKDVISVMEMTEYDHAYFIEVFETHTKTVEESHKTNYHDPKISIGDCISWTGYIHVNGYAQCNYLGTTSAHVFSYKLWHFEDIPMGHQVRHKCLNMRNCVNPEHLELGTAKQNGEDRKRDGATNKGIKHSNNKLTEEEVRQIFEAGKKGETQEERANKFNVNKQSVGHIDTGTTWSHLWTKEELAEIKEKNQKRTKPRKGILNFERAEKIRETYKSGEKTVGELATTYNVDPKTIHDVLKKQTYSSPPQSKEQKLKVYCAKTRGRVLSHVDKVVSEIDGQEHWIWNGASFGGYGKANWKSKPIGAHIASYLAFNNIDLEEKDWDGILHSCQEKKCVNPEHLRAGTHKENGEDRVKDGTSGRGENNGRSKISEDLARQIKKSKGSGTRKQRAKRFKTSLGVVAHIDTGSTWGWLCDQQEDPQEKPPT